MTQDEAKAKLTEIMGRGIELCQECTGNRDTCPIPECALCSVRDCPHDEVFHYHHDGCPACYHLAYNDD